MDGHDGQDDTMWLTRKQCMIYDSPISPAREDGKVEGGSSRTTGKPGETQTPAWNRVTLGVGWGFGWVTGSGGVLIGIRLIRVGSRHGQ